MDDRVVAITGTSGELRFISVVSILSGNGLGVFPASFPGLILGFLVCSTVIVETSRLCGLKADIIRLPMLKSLGPVGLTELNGRGDSGSEESRLIHLASPTRLIGL